MCGLFGGIDLNNTLYPEGMEISGEDNYSSLMTMVKQVSIHKGILRSRGTDYVGMMVDAYKPDVVPMTTYTVKTHKVDQPDGIWKDVYLTFSDFWEVNPSIIMGSYRGVPVTEDKNIHRIIGAAQPFLLSNKDTFDKSKLPPSGIFPDITLFITHNGLIHEPQTCFKNYVTFLFNYLLDFNPTESDIGLFRYLREAIIQLPPETTIDSNYVGQALILLQTVSSLHSQVESEMLRDNIIKLSQNNFQASYDTLLSHFDGSPTMGVYSLMKDNVTGEDSALLFLNSSFRQLHFVHTDNKFIWASEAAPLYSLSKFTEQPVHVDVIDPYHSIVFNMTPTPSTSKENEQAIHALNRYRATKTARKANHIRSKLSNEDGGSEPKNLRFINAKLKGPSHPSMLPFYDEIYEKHNPSKTNFTRSAVVISGGLDSTVSAYLVAEEMQRYREANIAGDYELHLLHFKYGAKAERRELSSVKKTLKDLSNKYPDIKVHLEVINAAWLKQNSENEWVPARNLWMLGTAASYCDCHDIGHIALGFNEAEGSISNDNSTEFIDAMNTVLNVGTKSRPNLVMPVSGMMKHNIIQKAHDEGFPIKNSWSCYHDGKLHCGNCGPCYLRLRGHKIAKVKETIKYENYPEWFPVGLVKK